MSDRLRSPRRRAWNIVVGILRLARGRADGLQQFGTTRDAFLASIAPLVAFLLVGGVRMLLDGGGLAAISEVMVALCALLAQLVLSFELARLWRRQQLWLRFATAFNWCQWVILAVGIGLLVLFGIMAAMGLPRPLARTGGFLAVATYGLWLHWFLARHGLGLSALRALLMVFVVNLGTALLVAAPRMATLGMTGT